MDALLRYYEREECGEDGYPVAWHASTSYGSYPSGSPLANPAIKNLIREAAENRCQRCRHPYTKGEIEEGWSDCDAECKHFGDDQRGWNFKTHQWVLGRNDQISAGQLVLGGRRMQARWRILTVHHLDEDKRNCCWWNLVALCQRCHLRMQRKVVMDKPWVYEHTDWFKPYAAGFYAQKYLPAMIDGGTYDELDPLLQNFYALSAEFFVGPPAPTITPTRTYERRDLNPSRGEIEEALEPLLAFEHRFKQEALILEGI